MIKNGLYALSIELQDGIQGGGNGVLVLRDGTIRGGDSFFYFTGSYVCCGGKWKGEATSQEHTLDLATRPFARKIATIGFCGTYSDHGAENDNTALLGNRSISFRTTLRLLLADQDGDMPKFDHRHDEACRLDETGAFALVGRQ
ncbi:hypothetical protein FJN17_18925 [Bradyrhizobium symbiodeficiens]|uniref:Type III secretion system (T3SS) negative regulator GrlR n=1 Tax=Bradyrhizobium symbiodeficiens TaxID=1404367 RepID=A0ABZ2F1C1_9BRAD|nr:hypothetical protein [Bradyrhizobium symbiodeficiens]